MKNHIGKYNSEEELNFALSKEELFAPYVAIAKDGTPEDLWLFITSHNYPYENVWLAGGRDNDTIYVKDKEGNISKFTLIGNVQIGPCIPKDSIENFVAAGSFGNTDCTLTSISYINNVELGKVKDFTDFWYNLSSLTSFPLIDTSNGEIFLQAWRNCNKLTTFPALDFSKAKSLRYAWAYCSNLSTFPVIDTSNVTNFSHSWDNCSKLTEFPALNMGNGTNFSFAWAMCSSLTKFPMVDVHSGTNFQSAWFRCSSLTEFPMLDLSNGTNFSSAWAGCSNLTEFPALDLHNGTDFSSAWNGCTALTTIPQLDLSSGTNFSSAWNGCSNLTNLGGFGPIKESIDLTGSPKLTFESIMNVINQAANLNELGITGKSMNFGSNNWDKFSDEQNAAAIAAATSKGWTLL